MGQNKDNFKRGTAELLVLHLLMEKDLYGYQITQEFSQRSGGVYTMLEGSLYPILYRLTDNGYISDYTKPAGVRRMRKYYHIEEKGKTYYREILKDYDHITDSISQILGRTPTPD